MAKFRMVPENRKRHERAHAHPPAIPGINEVRRNRRNIYQPTNQPMRAFVVFSNGKNGTIGRHIPFKVLPIVPLVMPLVPMVPMLPTYGSKWCTQNTAWVILPTREKSRDSIWRAYIMNFVHKQYFCDISKCKCYK